MIAKAVRSTVAAVTCMIMLVPLAYGGEAQTNSVTIESFMPKWHKGQAWKLRIWCRAIEYAVPSDRIMRSRDCLMTVIDVPGEKNDCFVLRAFVDRTQKCQFFVLDAKDLSLREFREAEGINPIDLKRPDEVDVKFEDARHPSRYPGGVPRFVFTDLLRIVFPVFIPGDETTNIFDDRPLSSVVAQRQGIENGAAPKLVFTIAKGGSYCQADKVDEVANALRRLDEKPRDDSCYEIKWELGAPWWQSCVRYSITDSRVELLDANAGE